MRKTWIIFGIVFALIFLISGIATKACTSSNPNTMENLDCLLYAIPYFPIFLIAASTSSDLSIDSLTLPVLISIGMVFGFIFGAIIGLIVQKFKK